MFVEQNPSKHQHLMHSCTKSILSSVCSSTFDFQASFALHPEPCVISSLFISVDAILIDDVTI